MKNLNLIELKEIKSKLENLIEKERKYLGKYKNFYPKNGTYYFHLRTTGIHLSFDAVKLSDLDLTDKQKENIKSTCDNIIRFENRLIEINNEIQKRYYGDKFNKNLSTQNSFAPNRKYTDEMFEYMSKLLLEGKKKYVAGTETLKRFHMDISKDESFTKHYDDYIKKK